MRKISDIYCNLLRFLKDLIKKNLRKVGQRILRHPDLKNAINASLRLFPPLHRKIKRLMFSLPLQGKSDQSFFCPMTKDAQEVYFLLRKYVRKKDPEKKGNLA